MSTHGFQKQGVKYSCDSDYGTRVKRPLPKGGDVVVRQGAKLFCGRQLWESNLETPVVDALEEALKDFKPRLRLARKLKDAQQRLRKSESEFDLITRRALSNEEISDEQVNACITEAKRKVDVRREELGILREGLTRSCPREMLLRPISGGSLRV